MQPPARPPPREGRPPARGCGPVPRSPKEPQKVPSAFCWGSLRSARALLTPRCSFVLILLGQREKWGWGLRSLQASSAWGRLCHVWKDQRATTTE